MVIESHFQAKNRTKGGMVIEMVPGKVNACIDGKEMADLENCTGAVEVRDRARPAGAS
jgi:hypothetical protein